MLQAQKDANFSEEDDDEGESEVDDEEEEGEEEEDEDHEQEVTKVTPKASVPVQPTDINKNQKDEDTSRGILKPEQR